MAVTWLADFFAEESKLIARGENAYKSNRMEELRLDQATGMMTGRVKSSLKEGQSVLRAGTLCAFVHMTLRLLTLPQIIKWVIWAYCSLRRSSKLPEESDA